MKKEIIKGMLVTAISSCIVILISYLNMSRGDKMYGTYGLTVLFIGAFEVFVGIALMAIPSTRKYAGGVLISALLTLLVGGSICTNIIKI
jgi:hypothetical protein